MKDAVQTPASYGQSIIAATNGFVFYADSFAYDAAAQMWQAVNARCIRRWGTSDGLSQLVKGPTSETVLDAVAPSLEIAPVALIFVMPCTGNWGT